MIYSDEELLGWGIPVKMKPKTGSTGGRAGGTKYVTGKSGGYYKPSAGGRAGGGYKKNSAGGRSGGDDPFQQYLKTVKVKDTTAYDNINKYAKDWTEENKLKEIVKAQQKKGYYDEFNPDTNTITVHPRQGQFYDPPLNLVQDVVDLTRAGTDAVKEGVNDAVDTAKGWFNLDWTTWLIIGGGAIVLILLLSKSSTLIREIKS